MSSNSKIDKVGISVWFGIITGMLTWSFGIYFCHDFDILSLHSNYFDFPNRILDEAKNISFNATAAFKAYSNIKDYIDEAEKVAKEAKELAQEAAVLVRNKLHHVLRMEVNLSEQVAKLNFADSYELWKMPINQKSHFELFLNTLLKFNPKKMLNIL